MKNVSAIVLIVTACWITGCSDVKRAPGRDYMPDMRYSRAYETYSPHENLKERGINYTALPVAGTVKRGELFPFPIPKDKEGDSTNYVAARAVQNPLPLLDTTRLKEAERLYLINCAICHGTNLDGNGPLYNGGNGPYPAAPRNLVSDPLTVNMPEGQMFYSVTYGKGAMGPYGPQLTTTQRWQIVHFIKAKQRGAAGGSAATDAKATSDGGSGSTNPSPDGGVTNLNATPDTSGKGTRQ